LSSLSCPYMEECTAVYKKAIDCYTERHVRCIGYDFFRIRELNTIVKNYYNESGGIK